MQALDLQHFSVSMLPLQLTAFDALQKGAPCPVALLLCMPESHIPFSGTCACAARAAGWQGLPEDAEVSVDLSLGGPGVA
jgi:hypothetical protein